MCCGLSVREIVANLDGDLSPFPYPASEGAAGPASIQALCHLISHMLSASSRAPLRNGSARSREVGSSKELLFEELIRSLEAVWFVAGLECPHFCARTCRRACVRDPAWRDGFGQEGRSTRPPFAFKTLHHVASFLPCFKNWARRPGKSLNPNPIAVAGRRIRPAPAGRGR